MAARGQTQTEKWKKIEWGEGALCRTHLVDPSDLMAANARAGMSHWETLARAEDGDVDSQQCTGDSAFKQELLGSLVGLRCR